MRKLLLSTLVLGFSDLSLAGPNAAVFCHQFVDGAESSFQAFDIATSERVMLLRLDGEHPSVSEGKRKFFLKDSEDYQPRIVEKNTFRTSLGYENQFGQRPLLRSSENEEEILGRIIKITYMTNQPVRINPSLKRTGRVIVDLQEGSVARLMFSNCHYEGALVNDWASIWAPND